ncbi:MAG: hypothetical protein NZZ41_02230 [Candidatus Dojkabacteria bacterium]|nr:hypothetical protein [Candidatus Dojkabacteria bacterium]
MNNAEKKKIKNYILELFKDLEFEEESHRYSLKSHPEKKLVSVTSLIKKLDSFDEEYWSKKKAKELGVSAEQIKDEWKNISKAATERGTIVHKYMENKALGRKADNSGVEKYRSTLMRLYRDLVKKYKVICTELRMYDPDLGISGTCDKLAFNVETKKFALLDYKTGKPLEKNPTYVDKSTGEVKESKFKLNPPYSHLPNSNYWKYCLQLSVYRYILGKRGIKVDEGLLIHISEDDFKYHPVEFLDVEPLWSLLI